MIQNQRLASRGSRLAQLCTAATMVVVFAILIAGCGHQTTSSSDHHLGAGSQSHAKQNDHSSTSHLHIAPHGGEVQSVGENHFELTYDGETGTFTLYVLGEDETKAAPIAETEITLQVRDEKSGEFKTAALSAKPLEGEAAGSSSRFSAASDDLTKLGDFTAVARVPVAGQSHRVPFQFVGGQPISAGMVDGFACPMACEKNKVYKEAGKCPVCKMKLEEHKAGMTAHADHEPKHGGLFFMAPDQWHHLEGTLVNEHTLRVYLYDNFTKALDSSGYSGELKVQPVNDQDDPVGEPVTVSLDSVAGKPFLEAKLPDSIKPPYQTEARLRFPNAKDKYLFNFDFKSVQHKD